MKAQRSMGEEQINAFNDRVAQVQPHCEEQCVNLEVVDDGASSLKKL